MDYFNRHFVLIVCLLCTLCWGRAGAVSDAPSPAANPVAETAVLLPVWLGEGFATSSTEHFFVAHDAGQTEAGILAERLETAFEHFRLFFSQHGYTLPNPTQKLSWISFSNPDHFSQYALRADRMDLSRLKGYYSARTNRVAIVGPHAVPAPSRIDPVRTVNAAEGDGDIAALAGSEGDDKFIKIAHELAHQIAFNTGLQKRGVMYPLWVSEGLATQYETKLTYCRDINTARSERLMQMQAAERLIPLEELLAITRLPADRFLCEDLYAQAWGFFDFLLQERPEQLRHYLDTLYNIRLGARSPAVLNEEFAASFGSIDVLSTDWIDYLRRP